MTTDDVFHEWVNQQDWINWKDPHSVRKAFILFGDYCKDKYFEFRSSKESFELPLALEFGYKQCEKGNNIQMALSEWKKLTTKDEK